MKTLFYLTHTLYAKTLIPLAAKLASRGHDIYISKNKFDFLKYRPQRYASTPISNTFVNQSSFDYVARIIGYSDEWNGIKDKVKFTFSRNPRSYDAVIGTTKNLDVLEALQRKCPDRDFFAVGYQHMPFILSLKGDFKNRNLPDKCANVFTETNPFSKIHRFPEYISDHKISFRSFPYLEKVYTYYYLRHLEKKDKPKRFVLIFHPGGYRDVITKMGDNKRISYLKQKDFITTICGPILKKGLIPVIKIHPLAARYHFKKDTSEILDSLSKDRADYNKVIVEDSNYYKYVYESDTIIGFGSSSIYELFSMKAQNVIICNFFGKARSDKFSFMKGIFVETIQDYNNFWEEKKASHFSNVYRKNETLNNVYESYSGLFADNISEQILNDIGLS